MSLRRLLSLGALTCALASTAAEPAPVAEVVFLDGTRAPLTKEMKPVTVLLLWTSLSADPEGQLRQFDAIADRYAKDARVAALSISIDQAKSAEDLAVIQEIVSAAKVHTRSAADSKFRVLGVVQETDYGGKPPAELRVPIVAVFREGKVVHKDGLSRSVSPEDTAAHYGEIIDAELAKLPKAKKKRAPAAKR